MSVRLRTKWLCVQILLLSFKLQTWPLLHARSSLRFRRTIECGFTLKLVCDMIVTYSLKCFPVGPFFLVFLLKCLSECSSFNPHIQAYSGIFSTLCQPCIFTTLTIFWALTYLELEAYLNPCEMLTRHIQNPAIGHYSAMFRHFQNLVPSLHSQKPDILAILEYSKPFCSWIVTYIQNSDIFKTRIILKTLSKI